MSTGTRLRAASVLIAVFFVGAIAGLVFEEVADDWWVLEMLERPDGGLEDTEERVLREISLSLDQRRRVQEILQKREDELESYWLMQVPELQTLVEASRDELRAVLDEEQRADFDRRLDEALGVP